MPRRIKDSPIVQDGWSRWTHALGFSFKAGKLRADMWPAWDDTVENWRAEIWRGTERDEVLVTLRDRDHWRLTERVVEEVDRRRRSGG